MRYLILAIITCSLCAADAKPLPRETLTLTDGRTITGTYNEEAQKLTLDGGKMSLTITPDQIKERKPADPFAGTALADEPSGLDTKSMTAEEKSKAVAGFKEGKRLAALEALDAQASKLDHDAIILRDKAKAFRAKARVAADSYRTRSALEGENYDTEKILKDPLITRTTHANNSAILGLMTDAARFEQEAKDKEALAKAKHIEAHPEAVKQPINPGPPHGPDGSQMPPGWRPGTPAR